MRLEVSEEEFGKGGMRIARKATVLEGLSHDLLKTFSKGTDVLLKHYNDTDSSFLFNTVPTFCSSYCSLLSTVFLRYHI